MTTSRTNKRALDLILGSLLMVFPVVAQAGGPASAAARAANTADGSGGWVVLDRVVARVNGSPVLLSDIMLERDLGLLEGEQGATDEASLISIYLRRRMILEEVREFGGFSLSPAESQGASAGYLRRFPDPAAFSTLLDRWGITRGEVLRRLEEALTASLYTESRVRFFIQVLPGDVERAYAGDPPRWKGVSLEKAWAEIQGELTGEAFRREVGRWLDVLRDRYRVEVFGTAAVKAR
jgi:hypothetical protein